MLLLLLRDILPRHKWEIEHGTRLRRCLVCGKIERFHIGSASTSKSWLTVDRGNSKKHRIAADFSRRAYEIATGDVSVHRAAPEFHSTANKNVTIHTRTDRITAERIDRALILQRALGNKAARIYLSIRGVRPALMKRVLAASATQRRLN